MSSPSYGYSPDFVKKALIKFVELLASLLSLRRPCVFSAEFSNIVKPRKSIEFNSRKFFFRLTTVDCYGDVKLYLPMNLL